MKAPAGTFLNLSQITGNAFALGTLTTDLFAFDITSYYLSYIGAGGLNDGSCPADEVAVAFSGGDIVCEPAPLVGSLSTPLCTTGDVFVGWL